MPRIFSGETLVIASHNPGKVAEIAALLNGRVARIEAAASLGIVEPEETGDTFAANAALKARHVATAAGLPALADDSGLVVTALGGAPGIRSARWAVKEDGSRDFAEAMAKVEALLEDGKAAGPPDRSAKFVAALSLAWPDGHVETVEGEVAGTLVWPPRGQRGFGYDPMFVPQGGGGGETFGEMEPAAKHRISHRAVAFRRLMARCFPA